MPPKSIKGLLVDTWKEKIYPAEILFEKGRIKDVEELTDVSDEEIASYSYIMPGFVDSHVHIESSMLVPSQFARMAVVHGTVATVSDPHEIANVCGMEGVMYMVAEGKTIPFKFYFGAPSCVPATAFETTGSRLDTFGVQWLLMRDEIKYLSEMMNFPGVLHNDQEVLMKMETAHLLGKPVDGHAPGLTGEELKHYIEHGISTDHECVTIEEALEKLAFGMKIIIREGSAAKNFDALIPLLADFPDHIMFCSDDKHPDSLEAGHINQLCARAIAQGHNLWHVLKAACINPLKHYNLGVGVLQPGDSADFIIVKDLETFRVERTYINGRLVAKNGESLINPLPAPPINKFLCSPKTVADLAMPFEGDKTVPVIVALDGQLITHKAMMEPKVVNGEMVSDVSRDMLKMVVVNRYTEEKVPVAKAFITNFGLKEGAIASSVAHDSHNIVAVGVDDESICRAVNTIIAAKGGISCVGTESEMLLALPIAGLMSGEDGYSVAKAYTNIDAMAKSLGSTLSAPFMTLSFMSLLVIPHLKLSDRGLFDADQFSLIVISPDYGL